MTLVLLLGVLALVGCDDDDDNGAGGSAAQPADLQNLAFVFTNGSVFGIDATLGPATLIFGAFTGNTAPFRLEAGGFSATGEATIASCDLQTNIGDFPQNQGPQAGMMITLDPCLFDASTNELTVTNGAITATSGPGTAADNPPGGTGRLRTPSRSTSIAMTANDRFLVVANREMHSVSLLAVRDQNGQDVMEKLAERAVGREPRYLALSPDDREVYVTNTESGTVSVIEILSSAFGLVAEIDVGSEPRGCAVTPNGTQLYVANHTAGTVSVIDVSSRQVVATVNVGGNPTAIAITNDGDADDTDETVYVTDFFARLIPGGPGEGFDTGKQGLVRAFDTGAATSGPTITEITLSPLADSGFTADRTPFCTATNPNAANNTFCPQGNITADPQGVHPNQLQAALIRNDRLYLPNIGAQPEPPVRFNVNVQALVHVVDTAATPPVELPNLHVNLNPQVRTERQAGNTMGLDGRFGNDIVAIDANTAGSVFLIVSRGGNYVFRASLDNSQLDLGAPDIIRYQTGNIPNGVVISDDATRAYVNNEVGVSVSAINLETNVVIARDIPSGTPPEPGTFDHAVLVGKLAFFTALGIPDNGVFDTPIRDIVPLDDSGKASDNAWSSCASCHPDGLADGVTWIFPTGPRQAVPLDAFFAKDNPGDQRISNWSAVRGSITDFNNNSRNIQGGLGFAGEPPNPNIYNHGITQGASDALDAQTVWVQTVRAPILPAADDAAAATAGATVFMTNCASCHGGAKWTKSQIFHADNPAFDSNPLAGGEPRDPGITHAGPQILSYTVGSQMLTFLEDIGTFDAADPLEIRGAGMIGAGAVGALGFNVPSLLGTRYHAPYFHHGQAQSLEDVFDMHAFNGGTIQDQLDATDRANLLAFLNTIDGSTDQQRSAGDDFRDGIAPITLNVTLDGGQEVPPVVTDATGTATLIVNAVQNEIEFTLTVQGVADPDMMTQAHIHAGDAMTNGPVVAFLCTDLGNAPVGVPTPPACPNDVGGGQVTVTGTLSAEDLIQCDATQVGCPATEIRSFADLMTTLLSGNTYINVHSVDFPAGIIRGQIPAAN